MRLGTLRESVTWGDVLPLAMLGAIGHTVSLLLSRLAFSDARAEEPLHGGGARRVGARVACCRHLASATTTSRVTARSTL
jgi:Na+/H+ antiporter 1